MKKFSLFLLVLLFSISIASASVKISEVKSEGAEFVEIYNPEKELINLENWTILDNSYPDTFTCLEENCSLETDAEYFIIIGRAISINNLTSKDIIYFFTDDQKIGNGLNSTGEIIMIKNNNETLDSYEYRKISNSSFSLQFVDDDWCEGTPTPGEKNKCAEETPPAEEPENETVPPDDETLNVTGNDTEIPDESADTGNESSDIASNITTKQTAVKKTITTQTVNENTSSESKKVIYQSKNEKTRETAIYLLIALLVLIIIYLIKSKNI